MVTKEQAMKANTFHYGECKRTVGPRGGITIKREVWRRNGKTRLWKTRPEQFTVPLMHGLRDHGWLDEENAAEFHLPENCPAQSGHKYEVEFDRDIGCNPRTVRVPIADATDAEIEAARAVVEKRYERLPTDPRTGFPSFTVYEDGEEIGGG